MHTTMAPVPGRHYTLVLLWASYTFSILDRYAMGILAEPIKHDLQLSDTLLGVLTGAIFGLFYITLALPVARYADRGNRRNLIAAALATWSFFTMACGLAASAVQLALARLLVGVGEAGSNPPAQSMIADLYPPAQRGKALGFFTSGTNIGIVLAYAVAGAVSARWGWRAAFIALGAPGLLLALLVRLTVREPLRGQLDANAAAGAHHAPDADGGGGIAAVARHMAANRGVRHVFCAAMFGTAGTSIFMLWMAPFLMRTHGMPQAQAGAALGLIFGLCGGAGTFALGWLSDRLGGARLPHRATLAAGAQFLLWPLLVAALMAPSEMTAMACLLIPGVLITAPLAVCWAILQSAVPAAMRATASAIALFGANITGLVLGPTLAGAVSDLAGAGDAANGLRIALLLFTPLFGLSGLHFLLAARAFRREQP